MAGTAPHNMENLGKEKGMAKKGKVYKCDVCGNVVSVVQGGDGDLVCCGQNMRLLSEEEVGKLSMNGVAEDGRLRQHRFGNP